MRKRSKKRIPQEISPWQRVEKYGDDVLHFVDTFKTRWRSGNLRESQTTILKNYQKIVNTKLLFNIFFQKFKITKKSSRDNLQLFSKKFFLKKKSNISALKNGCLAIGGCGSFNRKLLLNRHSMRLLLRDSNIVGLIKS